MSYADAIRQHAGVQKRVEIIYSQAIEEDFVQLFKENNVAGRYTKIAGIMGAGYSNPRLGDAIWPQLNVMYIVYCSEEDCKKIGEGIACFVSESEEV